MYSVQIVFMLASLAPSFALDRMGRRKTLMFGLSGIGFSMMMIAILLSISNNTKTASASVAFFFLVSYSCFDITISDSSTAFKWLTVGIVRVHLWSDHQLCSLGLCARDPTSSCPSPGCKFGKCCSMGLGMCHALHAELSRRKSLTDLS